MLSKLYSRICCETLPNFPVPYRFEFGEGREAVNVLNFQTNQIKTTKYNLANFLPKTIISQYRRLANLYFLIVAIISTIPGVTPLNPGLIWAPLVFVLIISLVKELFEEFTRFKSDQQVNDQNEVIVLRAGKQEKVKWKDLIVGDICKVKELQTFPADLVLISSSNKDGVAYIQTATLDGELTSKIRYAFQDLNLQYSSEGNRPKGSFEGELPNCLLSVFRGTLQMQNRKYEMTDNNQLLFRGAKLKNTGWILGLVVYTGQCSKIMMNGQNFVTKLSNLQKKLNYLLVVMLIIQIGGCLTITSLSVPKQMSISESQNYILEPVGYDKSQMFLMNFLLFFIEYSSFIPVSLIVTIEIAKTAQSYFIDFDQLMFSSWRKRKAFARIASLNEQLGQVEHIFCDKTGTLTKNELKFHTAVIGEMSYEFQYNTQTKKYKNQAIERVMAQVDTNHSHKVSTPNKFRHLLNSHRLEVEQYIMALLLCNNISIVGNQSQGIKYQSESPDEIAFASLARDLGFIFLKRDKNSVLISIYGVPHKVQVITRFAFTSERKRMSIIVKWQGSYVLYAKGADDVILQRTSQSLFNAPLSIDRLSRQGLRSLLVAFRPIPTSQVFRFIKEFEEASMEDKQVVRNQFADEFENSLTVIGATGLLDQLQSGVPETLRDIQRAGIKVWMLTGDKLETAIEVGKTCNLIEPEYEIVLMRNSSLPVQQLIEDWHKRINGNISKYSLVIEGSVLANVFGNDDMEKMFAEFSLFFTSVICCRMLPAQKSQAVKMVKNWLEKICLAVGDGGNDVSMIKEANIGIGIYGEEGMSAVQASDYAIPEFRMIWRLLFVHGRWNYIRISEMVLYFVYKSVVFTVPRFLFSFSNAYSGYPIYDDYYIALYSMIFTALPLLVRALFEQDFNYVRKSPFPQNIDENKTQIQNQELKYLPKGYTISKGLRKLFPKIYFTGSKNVYFNLKQCFYWVIQAVIMGTCIFFIIIKGLGHQSISQNGYNSNLSFISITIFTGIIIVDTFKLCIQVKYWTKLLFFTIIFLSITPYIGFMWVINYYFNRPVSRILLLCFTSAKAYFSIFFLIIVLIGLNGVMVYIRFHSHQILKKMTIALEQDHEMMEYIQNNSDSSMAESLRQSRNPLKASSNQIINSHNYIYE